MTEQSAIAALLSTARVKFISVLVGERIATRHRIQSNSISMKSCMN